MPRLLVIPYHNLIVDKSKVTFTFADADTQFRLFDQTLALSTGAAERITM